MRKDFEFEIEDIIEQWIDVFDEYSEDYALFEQIDTVLKGWELGKFFNQNTLFKFRSIYFHKVRIWFNFLF